MAETYQQLNEEERDTLAILLSRGRKLRDIARFLGRSAGTLSREIQRNTSLTGYRPHSANITARQRFQQSHQRPRLPNPEIQKHVEQGLRRGWSSEIIAGRLKRGSTPLRVSHEAIYQRSYSEARHLIPSLVRGHRRRRRRSKIPCPKVLIPSVSPSMSALRRSTLACNPAIGKQTCSAALDTRPFRSPSRERSV